ncbi:MAG TPA: SRPBCC family protein [Actinomycetes bacterium]|nr:SRPBCC family protein [Actinomycetes bacterium]
MRIDNEFTVGVPLERAWEVLTDLEGIAPCMPGARLTGVDGDVFSGEVRVKVGPVVSQYAGTATFASKDDAAHRAVIDAKGKDSRGSGNASALITAQLHADGADRTVVTVETDLTISGKIAQLGGGMIKEVSTKLLGQFVACLEQRLAADVREPAPVAAEATAEGSSETASAPAPAIVAPRIVAVPDPEEPVDLMSLAGGSLAKRLVPLAVGVAVVAVVVYVLRR